MKNRSQWLKGLIVIILVMLVALVAGAYHALTSQPKGPLRQLPIGQIALDSTEGRRLLKESRAKAMFERLINALQTQKRPAYCGVASSVSTLNTLLPSKKVTQESFFTKDASKVVSSFWVTLRGMTLDELTGLLKSYKLQVDQHFASSSSLKSFRKLAVERLKKEGNIVVLAYSRKKLNQKGAGHISPLGAYHAKSDRFLVLDVASYKYPPHWVKAKKLWEAINTVDSSTNKTRGFVLVSSKTSNGKRRRAAK